MVSKNNKYGFTLLEVMLSIAIVAILTSTTAPVSRFLLAKNDLDVAVVTTAQSLRRAQLLAQTVEGDSTWGTKIQNGSVTIFKGSSYASRDTLYDETFELVDVIVPSGTTEFVFSRVYGEPIATGSVTLTSSSDVKTLTINYKGTVSY